MKARRAPWLLFSLALAVSVAAVIGGAEEFGIDAIWGLPFLAYGAVGALVASHRPENRIGWVFLAIALFGAAASVWVWAEALVDTPGWEVVGNVLGLLSVLGWFGGLVVMLTLALLLFPDGRLPGPRWRVVAWIAVVVIPVTAVAEHLASDVTAPPEAVASVAEVVAGIGLVVFLAAAVASIASVVVRFRRSRDAERQQLKWFTYAAGLLAVGVALTTLAEATVGTEQDDALVYVAGIVLALTITGLPVSAGVAVLRYRLYDIDRVINQTVVYGLLTAALVGIYVGTVAGIGSVARALTGQESNSLVIVVSTLAVAALFRPLRARFQTFIDRRFYRQRYDAAATLDGFSARLRDQVDLESLRSEIVTVVGNTMQPAHASVWLRSRKEVR